MFCRTPFNLMCLLFLLGEVRVILAGNPEVSCVLSAPHGGDTPAGLSSPSTAVTWFPGFLLSGLLGRKAPSPVGAMWVTELGQVTN